MDSANPKNEIPNLYAYSDYRAYLRDLIQYRKKIGKPASNRWFAQRVGINSSSWMTVILSGKKGMSAETAKSLSGVLRHTPNETRYFEALVLFNQARSLGDQKRYSDEMLTYRRAEMIASLGESQQSFYSAWYHSVIWSLLDLYSFSDDYEWLAEKVAPPISVEEAKESVALLESIGLVIRDDNNICRTTNKLISSGETVRALATAQFQQETMKLAWEAIHRFPRPERDMSTLTLGISEKTFEKIRQLAADFRRRALLLAQEDEGADEVYQCNVQLFPLTRRNRNRK